MAGRPCWHSHGLGNCNSISFGPLWLRMPASHSLPLEVLEGYISFSGSDRLLQFRPRWLRGSVGAPGWCWHRRCLNISLGMLGSGELDVWKSHSLIVTVMQPWSNRYNNVVAGLRLSRNCRVITMTLRTPKRHFAEKSSQELQGADAVVWPNHISPDLGSRTWQWQKKEQRRSPGGPWLQQV